MIDNIRIAKNTIYLYIRTFFVLIVSLYTSRLMLQALGETDLGIYNVVGGIVTLMAFFQQSQTKATSRFITYELGNKDKNGEPEKVFSICLTIHICIALVVILLGETIGFFIVNKWIDIPAERMITANWVYQFSLFTFSIRLIQVPYNAVIIAHEEMSLYAYISILDVVLKLVIAYQLLCCDADRLILYAEMLFFITLIVLFSYIICIKRKFHTYKSKLIWSKKMCMQIFSFSGWALLGSSANTAAQQSVSLLFNKFIGLVANTALGFTNQVNGAVMQFVGSFTTAFNPQIIKLYAQKDFSSLHLLMMRASKFSFFLAYLVALPLIVNMDFILQKWLGVIPQYTIEFCQLILICSVIDATTGVFNTAITATGEIKRYQIGISISFLLDVCFTFVLLFLKLSPIMVFASRILTRGIINMLIGFFYANRQLYFNIGSYLKKVQCPVLITTLFPLPIIYFFINYYTGWNLFLYSTISSTIILLLCLVIIIMDRRERDYLVSFISKRFC